MPRISLKDWPRVLEHQRRVLRPMITASLFRIGAEVEAIAKAKIGEYQPAIGGFPAWEKLAPATVEQKEWLGYAPPDNPLLRTGTLRDSITFEAADLMLVVGSRDPVAKWQEFGTKNGIPPRPFIHPAMYEGGTVIRRELGEVLATVLRTTDISSLPVRRPP